MAKAKDQQEKRRPAILTDQWGRKYRTVLERATGDPVGALVPVLAAPLGPPDDPDCWRVHSDEPNRITLLYENWLSKLEAAHLQWRSQIGRFAQAMYGEKAAEAVEHPSAELLNTVGPKPFPLEPVLAAREGNKYVLGLRPFDPKRPADVAVRNALDLYRASQNPLRAALPVSDGAWGDETPAPDEEAQVEAAVAAVERPRRGRPRREDPEPAGVTAEE